jgi:hypothetical protein
MAIGILGSAGLKRVFGLLSNEQANALGPGFWTGGHLSFLSLAVVAVAIITFFGVLMLERKSATGNALNEGALRRAITVSVLTVYLVTVGVVSFFRGGAKIPEVTSTFLTSFTATVGVVIAFFFGSSAYLESRTPVDKSSSNEESGTRDT